MVIVPYQILEDMKRQKQRPQLPPNRQIADAVHLQNKMSGILEKCQLYQKQKRRNGMLNLCSSYRFHTKVKDFTVQNIFDLIKDSLRLRKGIEPRGWETFSKALHESNVPQQNIGNQARCKWMQKQNIDDDEVTESESDYRNLISF